VLHRDPLLGFAGPRTLIDRNGDGYGRPLCPDVPFDRTRALNSSYHAPAVMPSEPACHLRRAAIGKQIGVSRSQRASERRTIRRGIICRTMVPLDIVANQRHARRASTRHIYANVLDAAG
jgi:hypothetical protein